MTATLAEVRDALAAALTTIPGLNALARMVAVNPPAALVELDRVEYHDASMNEPLWFFNITALVGMTDVEAAQNALDAYLAPEGGASIRKAIEDDPTLGGVVDDATVRSAAGYQPYDTGAETFLGARFSVEVRP